MSSFHKKQTFSLCILFIYTHCEWHRYVDLIIYDIYNEVIILPLLFIQVIFGNGNPPAEQSIFIDFPINISLSFGSCIQYGGTEQEIINIDIVDHGNQC